MNIKVKGGVCVTETMQAGRQAGGRDWAEKEEYQKEREHEEEPKIETHTQAVT